MAERGRKAKKRATATKRKKPVSRKGSGTTTTIEKTSIKPRSSKPGKPKPGKPKPGTSKSEPRKSPKLKSTGARVPTSENARLKSELRAARDRQAASAEVMRLISASPGNADQMLRRIAEITERLFGASSVSLLIADGEQWGRTIRVGAGSQRIATAIPLAHVTITSKFMPGAVYLENRQVHIPDADDPAAIARWPGLVPARAAGTRTMTGTPLRREGKAIGAFIVHRDRPVPFTEDELALLQTFADQAVIAIENVRLFGEVKARTHDLQESLKYQTATSDVLQVISRSTFDVQTVLDTLVESAYKLCGANLGLLYLRGEEAFECQAIAGVGVAEATSLFKGRPIRAGRGTAAERVILTGEVESITDFSKDPEMDPTIRQVIQNAAASTIGQIRSTLAVPMKRDNAVIGVMVIACSQTGPFPLRQIELLRTFANQAVIAIQNARLFNETKEALERQTATSEVLQVISRSPGELEPVFQTILDSATRICDAQFGLLLLLENDGFRCKSVFNLPPAFAETFSRNPVINPPPIDPLGRLIATRQIVHVRDVMQEPAYLEGFPPILDLVHLGGARTLLLVPMLKENSLGGVIAIFRQTVNAFSDKQVDLVTSFASQAVIAIENARLLNETREALERQTATSEVLQVISRSPGELEPVFQTILASANRICDAQFGQLFLYENNGFRCTSVLNLPPAFAETFSRNPIIYPPPIDPLGRLIATRQVVHVKDVTQEPAYLEGFPPIMELVHIGGARTILLVPMLRENSLAGVIAIFRQTVHEFTDKQIDLISSFASQAVIAIENARLLNETKEALERQTATADILKVIASSPDDVQPVFQAIAGRSNRLVNGLSTTVLTLVDDMIHLSAFTPTTPDADAALSAYFPRSLSALPFGEANRRGEIYHLPDTETDPTLRELARLRGYRSMLFVPLLHDGNPIGMIGQTKTEPGPFDENHVQLLKTFADQAIIAIENVRLFEQVQARTKDLSLSLEELRTAQDRLVQTEKLASLGQLTAGIAHEIKNPLNFVNNFSALSAELIDELNEALKSSVLDDKVREEIDELTQMLKGNLEKVVQHGKRADSIVKNMLVHSREGSGEHRLADINAIVEESLNLAYHGARAEKSGFNITLQRDLDPAAGMIDLYPQEITRVFLNLISNGFYAAAKRKEAGAEGFEPTLSATTKNLGDEVEIRIRDNGTGIPPEVKEKMFNPFFTTKPAGEGTGLGLSMSHDIVVKQHGGKIDVDTMPGAFTEFIITLPRTA